MPVFIDSEANRVVLINLKVMFSTLVAHSTYQGVSPAEAIRFVLRRSLSGKRPPMLMIVRNPYERLVSFFNDKLRGVPQAQDPSPTSTPTWQDVHRILFSQLGLAPGDPVDVVRKRLLATEFAEFIEILPKVYRADAHLRPQTDLLCKLPGIRPEWWLKRISLARMENLDAAELQRQWGIDIRVQQNFTGQSGNYTQYFTPRSFVIVNELYARDFALLGYRRE